MRNLSRLLMLLCAYMSLATAPAFAEQPIVTDSRIKTLVYNENDVFQIVTHYGYQTNIEFAKNEEVQTISLGDRVGWQVVPHDRRLFIRAMENGARTNMTVITNKRAYQFDLIATANKEKTVTPEISYVIRFYYPDEQPAYHGDAAQFSVSLQQASQSAAGNLNFNYTFTGPDALAPLKIFDNGKMTFFKMSGNADLPEPAFFVLGQNGAETPAPASRTSAGYYVVPAVAPRFIVRYGKEIVCIYNERH